MDPKFRKLNSVRGDSFIPSRRGERSSSANKQKYYPKFKKVLFIAGVIIILTFIWSLMTSTSSVFKYNFPAILQSNQLKSIDGRVNILLLGNAGGTHDGPDLTDSIIVASYHLKSKRVTFISIPRDLWVDSAKAKVNTLYHFGNKAGDGIKYTEDKIDDLLGFPIHYGVRLDFNGFQRAIDLVGGVEVNVPKTFDDYNYPLEGKENDLCGLIEKEVELTPDQIKALNVTEDKLNPASPSPNTTPNPDPNAPKRFKVLVDGSDKIATSAADFSCRFEHIHYEKGQEKMDGVSALKFVRSRMGTNGEGSDFARSRRQQLVLQSFRDKALSVQTLTSPKTVTDLIGTFGQSVETDIPFDKYLDFYNLVKKNERVENIVLGDLGTGKSILITPPPSEYGGAFVLIPPGGDFKKIQDFIKEKFREDEEELKKEQ